MAGSPQIKVFDRHGTYQASCKRLDDAAWLIIHMLGTIRTGHAKSDIIWDEGLEVVSMQDQPEDMPYDEWLQAFVIGAVAIMVKRLVQREIDREWAYRERVDSPETFQLWRDTHFFDSCHTPSDSDQTWDDGHFWRANDTYTDKVTAEIKYRYCGGPMPVRKKAVRATAR